MNDTFTPTEQAVFAEIAQAVIPPDPSRRLPGADDPAILDAAFVSAARQSDAVRHALAAWDGMRSSAGVDAEAFRSKHPASARLMQSLVALAYYGDPRVLHAHDLPARAPFPDGHDVEQGDWSLLEPVRARMPIWRDPT